MKIIKGLLLVMAFCLSSCSISSVQSDSDLLTLGDGKIEILVPSSLKVLAINGRNVQSPSLHDGQYRLLVNEGKQRLVVQYEDNWNGPDEFGYIIRWHPVAIDNNFQDGQRYVLTHAPLKDRDQAEEFSEQAPVWLIGANQKITGQLVKGETSSIQYLPVDENGQVSRLQQLQSMWLEARPDERKAFSSWMLEQQ